MEILDFGVGEPDKMAPKIIRDALKDTWIKPITEATQTMVLRFLRCGGAIYGRLF